MTFGQTSDSFRNILKYNGQDYRFAPVYYRNRDPSTSDTRPKEQQGWYPIGSLWVNPTTPNVWILGRIYGSGGNTLAQWIQLANSTITGPVLTLSDTGNANIVSPSGNADTPPGNIQLAAGSGITVVGTPGSHLLTISATGGGGTVSSLTGDDGVAVSPSGGTIDVVGHVVSTGTNSKAVYTKHTAGNIEEIQVQVAAANNLTDVTKVGLAAFNSAQFTVDANGFVSTAATGPILTLTGNTGGALSPTAGNFNVVGTGSITVAGSGSTETVQLAGLTNHSILIGAGTATITNLGPSSTVGQILQSRGASADPAFSTATYPSTTTANQILYSSANNTVTGLTSANGAVLATNSTGVPSFVSLTNGQVIIGATGGSATAATLTAGTGISITNAANSITISSSTVLAYTGINVASSPYTVLTTDDYISVDASGGAVTIKLPNAPTQYRTLIIKDRLGNASTNNISVTTVGGVVTIDGQTTYILDSNYSSIQLIFNGTNYEIY